MGISIDAVGNVWEMVYQNSSKKHEGIFPQDVQMIGGSFRTSASELLERRNLPANSNYSSEDLGFRIVIKRKDRNKI